MAGVDFESITLKEFDVSKLGKEERGIIRREKLIVAELDKKREKKGFVGYRIREKNIELADKKLRGRDVILLSKKLKGKELRKTFFHEVGHRGLDKLGLDKKLSREEKERLVENVARRKVGEKPIY